MGPSGAGVWSSPVVDPKTRSVFVGTGNQFTEPAVKTTDAVMAFNMDTGKLVVVFPGNAWRYLARRLHAGHSEGRIDLWHHDADGRPCLGECGERV